MPRTIHGLKFECFRDIPVVNLLYDARPPSAHVYILQENGRIFVVACSSLGQVQYGVKGDGDGGIPATA